MIQKDSIVDTQQKLDQAVNALNILENPEIDQ